MHSARIIPLVAVLFLAGNSVVASPLELVNRDVITCKKDDYGPFKLYAAPADGSKVAWQEVKLIDQPILTSNLPIIGTVQNLSVCPECGKLPSYWELRDQVLYAVFADAPKGSVTINRPVKVNSVVQFLRIDDPTAKKVLAPEWCAVRQPGAVNGLPGYLSVLGSPKDFSICTNMLGPGTPARQDVYYKANTMDGGLEKFCKPIFLAMQSIGIIPEPIPE